MSENIPATSSLFLSCDCRDTGFLASIKVSAPVSYIFGNLVLWQVIQLGFLISFPSLLIVLRHAKSKHTVMSTSCDESVTKSEFAGVMTQVLTATARWVRRVLTVICLTHLRSFNARTVHRWRWKKLSGQRLKPATSPGKSRHLKNMIRAYLDPFF